MIKLTKKIYFAVKKKKDNTEKILKFFLKKPYTYFSLFKTFKKRKKKTKYGVLRILSKKRNIFCTLSDRKGNMHCTVSSGLLKVKGRKRQALHIVKATGYLIIKKILKKKIKKLILIHQGKAFKKKKKTLLSTFSKNKKLKFLKINRSAPRSHNGCRPPKIRRK